MMLAHAMNDRAHKVNREDAVDVNKVEHHSHKKKAISPELRHGKDCGERSRALQRRFCMLTRRSTPMAERSRRSP